MLAFDDRAAAAVNDRERIGPPLAWWSVGLTGGGSELSDPAACTGLRLFNDS